MDTVLASSGRPLPPDWALQDPEDYLDVLRHAVPAAVADAGIDPAQVIGIGTDFTACTVLPVLADGTPLCDFLELRDRPHAYPKLWKHHASQPQADRITELAQARGEPWLARYGGEKSGRGAVWEGTSIFGGGAGHLPPPRPGVLGAPRGHLAPTRAPRPKAP